MYSNKYADYLESDNTNWWSYRFYLRDISYQHAEDNNEELEQFYYDCEEIEETDDIDKSFNTKNIYTVLSTYASSFTEKDSLDAIDKFVKLGGDLNKKYYYKTDLGNVPIPFIQHLLEYQQLNLIKKVVEYGVELPSDSIFHFFCGHGALWYNNVTNIELQWFIDRGYKYDLNEIDSFVGSDSVNYFKSLIT